MIELKHEVTDLEYLSDSAEKTIALGYKLGSSAKQGDIIVLDGDLGAGKTQFVKGFAKALDINDYITSPTFTIVNQYNGKLPLNHFDVYRVNDPDEIEAIGFDEYIYGNGVSIIEWGLYIESILPYERINIKINKNLELGDNYRKILISYNGSKYDYLKEIL